MVKNKNALWFEVFKFISILAPNIELKFKKSYTHIIAEKSPLQQVRFDLGFEISYFRRILW